MATHIEQKVSEGFIHFSAILEIVGKPKEHVDTTFAAFIAQMKKSTKYEIVVENINEAIAVEGSENLFSSFAEIEVLAKNMGALYDFCFECMPASIEILGPSEFKLKPNQASAAVNDLIARIHQLDMHAKQMTQQVNLYSENLSIMIENAIVIYLSNKPHNIEGISQAVGVPVAQLPQFIKNLIEKGKITETNGVYGVSGRSVKKNNSATESELPKSSEINVATDKKESPISLTQNAKNISKNKSKEKNKKKSKN